ncbi:MAG: hypothetical protein RLO49_17270, partial [Rhodospirillales bacterium]
MTATPSPPPTPHQAMAEILGAADWNGRGADTVSVTGNDPQLPTNFRIGTAGAAVLGAVGLAA